MRGVTLIELLVVIGLMSVLAGIGLQSGLGGFERSLARTDASRAGGILRHARSSGMHGKKNKVIWDDAAHGLAVMRVQADGTEDTESYELSPSARARSTGAILFSGANGRSQTSSLSFFLPGLSPWEMRVGAFDAIDMLHDL